MLPPALNGLALGLGGFAVLIREIAQAYGRLPWHFVLSNVIAHTLHALTFVLTLAFVLSVTHVCVTERQRISSRAPSSPSPSLSPPSALHCLLSPPALAALSTGPMAWGTMTTSMASIPELQALVWWLALCVHACIMAVYLVMVARRSRASPPSSKAVELTLVSVARDAIRHSKEASGTGSTAGLSDKRRVLPAAPSLGDSGNVHGNSISLAEGGPRTNIKHTAHPNAGLDTGSDQSTTLLPSAAPAPAAPAASAAPSPSPFVWDPSAFPPTVGIATFAAASLALPPFVRPSRYVSLTLLCYSTLWSMVILALLLKQYARNRNIPSTPPTVVLAAPFSLCGVALGSVRAQFNVQADPSANMWLSEVLFHLLFVCAVLLYLVVLTRMYGIINNGRFKAPSSAAFTFPLVVSATFFVRAHMRFSPIFGKAGTTVLAVVAVVVCVPFVVAVAGQYAMFLLRAACISRHQAATSTLSPRSEKDLVPTVHSESGFGEQGCVATNTPQSQLEIHVPENVLVRVASCDKVTGNLCPPPESDQSKFLEARTPECAAYDQSRTHGSADVPITCTD